MNVRIDWFLCCGFSGAGVDVVLYVLELMSKLTHCVVDMKAGLQQALQVRHVPILTYLLRRLGSWFNRHEVFFLATMLLMYIVS